MQKSVMAAFAVFVVAVAASGTAKAHCDSLDGPVVRDARAALETGAATIVLKWVSAEQEAELIEAFDRTVTVRALGLEARELADRLFFETLVRLHRASEGEAFTGLKPPGSTEPGLAMADAALAEGSADELIDEMVAAVEQSIAARFAAVREAESHAEESVAAGRAYVSAYVDYAHLVEQLHELANHGPSLRHHEPVGAVTH